MKRQALIALTALSALGLGLVAHAQNVTNPSPPFSVNGAYNATAPTCATGLGCWLQTDINGNLLTATASSSSAAAGATQISTAALAANLVVKATPGNLYSFEVAATSTLSAAAWWIMIYDSATAPADGGVTPAKCYAMSAGTTTFSAAFPNPVAFGTGIVIGVSTNGCFTKAASTQAFISGDFK